MEGIQALPLASQLNPENDEVTLMEAAQSDFAGFAQLYQCYQTRVYRYLLLRTRSREDADDLAQQVFTQALAALPYYHQQGTPFAAWLFRIARNLAIDHHRRQRDILPLDLMPELHPSSAEGDPERAVLQQEALAHLHALLARLDAGKRELVALRFASGLTVREIALIVGGSEEAIKKQLSRTLRLLKEQYVHDEG